MGQKNRLPEVDLVRGFAALCMVVGHAAESSSPGAAVEPWAALLVRWISSFHMPVFFIVAGLVWRYRSPYRSYLMSKVKRILVPFLFIGTLAVLAYSLPIANSMTAMGRRSVPDGMIELITGQGDFWFLYVIFEIFLIYPLILRLTRQRAYITAAVMIAVAALYAVFSASLPSIFYFGKFMRYLPYFMLGTLLHDAVFEGKLSDQKESTYLIAALVFLTCHAFLLPYAERWEAVGYPAAVIMFIALFCIAQILLRHEHRQPVKALGSFLKTLSIWSLQLYMFNHFIMTPTRYVLHHFFHLTDSASRILISASLCIALTGLACKLIIPKSKMLSFLCGNSAHTL